MTGLSVQFLTLDFPQNLQFNSKPIIFDDFRQKTHQNDQFMIQNSIKKTRFFLVYYNL